MQSLFVSAFLIFALFSPTPVEIVELKGTVLDGAGKPVEGAIVDLSSPFQVATTPLQTKTAADGTFRLKTKLDSAMQRGEGKLTVAKAGVGVFAQRMPAGSFRDPISIQLLSDSVCNIDVRSPSDQPVGNAEVALTRTGANRSGILPEAIMELTTVRTDIHGKVKLRISSLDTITSLRIRTSEWGTQFFEIIDPTDAISVKLSPVIEVQGRVEGVPSDQLNQIAIRINSSPAGNYLVRSEVVAKPDQDGNVKAIVLKGKQYVTCETRSDFPFRPTSQPTIVPKTNEVASFTLAMSKGIEIKGRVVAQGTQEPIADARIEFTTPIGNWVHVNTDAKGEYRLFSRPGPHPFSVSAPTQYLPLAEGNTIQTPTFVVPDNVSNHEFPAIELRKGKSIRGTVVDDRGKPVPYALLTGTVATVVGTFTEWRPTQSLTDSAGKFSMDGLSDSSSLDLVAGDDRGRFSQRAFDLKANQESLVLTVSEKNGCMISGRVTDPNGKPLAGVSIKVSIRDDKRNSSAPVQIDGSYFIKTDTAGAFATGKPLFRREKYFVTASKDGFASVTTHFFEPGKHDRPEILGPIVLTPLKTLTGKVVDKNNTPVAGARIVAFGAIGKPAQRMTNSAGVYTLTGLEGKEVVVIARATNMRTSGRLQPVNQSGDFRMESASDPSAVKRTAALSDRIEETEILKGREAAAPFIDKLLMDPKATTKRWVFQTYAKFDPQRAVQAVLSDTELTADEKDFVRFHLATVLAKRSPDDAVEIAAGAKEADMAASTRLRIAESLAETEKVRKSELVAQALPFARSVTVPWKKALSLGQAGEVLIKIGDIEGGTKILREAQEFASKLQLSEHDSMTRGLVAKSLALIDIPGALQLVESIPSPRDATRAYGNIAHAIAGRNPAEAEQVLETCRKKGNRNQWVARICYRMAPIDYARAKRLADSTKDGSTRARCYAVMAQAIAEKDKAAARQCLDLCFNTVEEESSTTSQSMAYFEGRASFAAAQLPIVNAVAPDLLDHYFWRTLAISCAEPAPRGDDADLIDRQRKRAIFAALIAPYDGQVARFIIDPAIDSCLMRMAPTKAERRMNQNDEFIKVVYSSAVSAAPLRLKSMLDALPPVTTTGITVVPNLVRMEVGISLASSQLQRVESLIDRHLHIWMIDREDI